MRTPRRNPTTRLSRRATVPEAPSVLVSASTSAPPPRHLRTPPGTAAGGSMSPVARSEELACRRQELVGKWANLETGHRCETIAWARAEDADRTGAAARRRPSAGLGALPRRRQQPRVPSLLCAPRGARGRADGYSRRTHYWVSPTCSSSCCRTTGRRASRSPGTRVPRTGPRWPRPPTSSTRRVGERCRISCASSSRTSGRSSRRSAIATWSSRAGKRTT